MKNKKLNILNIEKIVGREIGLGHKIIKVGMTMHWFLIYVSEAQTDKILEVKVKRISVNDYPPLYWKMKCGSMESNLYRTDLIDTDSFCRSLEFLLDPLPF